MNRGSNLVHYQKRNDTLTPFRADLWQADGTPLPTLNGVFWFFVRNERGVLVIQRPGTAETGTYDGRVTTRFQFQWLPGETALPPGDYLAEIEVQYGSPDQRLTIPTDDYFTIRVIEDLNPL